MQGSHPQYSKALSSQCLFSCIVFSEFLHKQLLISMMSRPYFLKINKKTRVLADPAYVNTHTHKSPHFIAITAMQLLRAPVYKSYSPYFKISWNPHPLLFLDIHWQHLPFRVLLSSRRFLYGTLLWLNILERKFENLEHKSRLFILSLDHTVNNDLCATFH